jgi:DNA-binding XRE family transcriptional regulator
MFLRPTASANWGAVIMPPQYPQSVVQRKPTICELVNPPVCDDNWAMKNSDYEHAEVGERLRRIRQGFSDLTQKAWAEKNGFNSTQYNNWEKGVRRIPVEAAAKLCDLYGLTLDAIYRGRVDGVSENARKVF